MSDFTGEQVLAVRKSLKLSREKFAAQVGLTPAKLHNIETGKRAMRPEERAALAVVMTGDRIALAPDPLPKVPSVAQTFPVGTNGTFIYLDEIDGVDDTLWLDILNHPNFGDTSALLQQPEVITELEAERTHAARVAELVQHLSPTSIEARAVLVGSLTPELWQVASDQDARIGVAGLYTEDGQRRITNSELQTFKHCRRKWWLGWYRGLAPRAQSQTGPLAIGTRIHEALAAYYVPGWQGTRPEQALEDALLRDETTLIGQLAEFEADPATQRLLDFKKEADLARAMIEGYVQWISETGADQGYAVIQSERTLTTSIETPSDDTPNIQLGGTVDVQLQREHDDAVLWMDHKTTQSFGQLTRMLLWDEQMQHYHVLEEGNRPEVVADDIADGVPLVDGALYNMLRKVKRTATAKPPFYERVEVRHNPHQVSNFKRRLVGETLQVMQVERSLQEGVGHQLAVYPSPSTRCLWGCEFSAVCPSFDDNSRAEDFVKDHFVTLNPLRRYDDRVSMNEES